MKQLSIFFCSLFIFLNCANLIAQKSNNKQKHIAELINHLEMVFLFDTEMPKHPIFNKKGSTYELAELSLENIHLTLEKLTPEIAEFSISDYGGTSYQSQAQLHYYVLKNKQPTIFVWASLKGTSYVSYGEFREDAYNEVMEELETQDKTQEDFSEAEFDSLLNKKTEEIMSHSKQDQTEPFFAEHGFNQTLLVWQKQNNVWKDITQTAFPSDFTAEFTSYFPFFKTQVPAHKLGYTIIGNWYDMDIEKNAALLQTIFGNNKTKNSLDLSYSPENGIEYISSANSNYELSLKWNGKAFQWDKKPNKKP